MTGSRLDLLKLQLEKDPADSFLKYAIGLEYMSSNQLEAARDFFEELKNCDPNYLATYYQLGKVYEKLGDEATAKKAYEKGIYVATQQNQEHTRSELEQALNDLL